MARIFPGRQRKWPDPPGGVRDRIGGVPSAEPASAARAFRSEGAQAHGHGWSAAEPVGQMRVASSCRPGGAGAACLRPSRAKSCGGAGRVHGLRCAPPVATFLCPCGADSAGLPGAGVSADSITDPTRVVPGTASATKRGNQKLETDNRDEADPPRRDGGLEVQCVPLLCEQCSPGMLTSREHRSRSSGSQLHRHSIG